MRAVTVLISVVSCLGCAPVRAPGPAAEDLESRVEAYWRLRQAKDLGALYGFYSAGYRSRQTREEFLKKRRLARFDILEFRVVQTAISGDRADVTVAYRTVAPPRIFEPFETKVTEPWVRDPDGRWYKEKETMLLPFPGPDGKPLIVED